MRSEAYEKLRLDVQIRVDELLQHGDIIEEYRSTTPWGDEPPKDASDEMLAIMIATYELFVPMMNEGNPDVALK